MSYYVALLMLVIIVGDIARSSVGFFSTLNSLSKSPDLRNSLFRTWINAEE